MAVYDRWHKSHPDPGKDTPCRCGRGKNKLYPTADHGCARRWQVRYRDDQGDQRKRNFVQRGGGRGQTDPEVYAEAYDAKVAHELNTDSWIDPELSKTTLEAYARQWRAALACDPSTLENIDKRLAHIYDVEAGPRSRRAEGSSLIAGMPLGALAKNPSAIQQWIKSLEGKGLSPVYIKMIVDTLSSIFIAAIDNGAISRNPAKAKSVRLPKIDEKVLAPWTPAMVAAARARLEQLNGTGVVADLGAGAGLRQGEIFGLALEDIVFLGADRKIRVRRQVKAIGNQLVFAPPKGGKERETPLSDALSRRLSAHIAAHPPVEVTLPWRRPDSKQLVTARLLLVRADGRPWHRQTYTHTWHKARAAAGAEQTRENGMHVLRHTYASVQLAAGVDVLKVARWIGHADAGFTLKVYGHFIPDAVGRGRLATDAFLDSGLDADAAAGTDQSALIVPSEGGP